MGEEVGFEGEAMYFFEDMLIKVAFETPKGRKHQGVGFNPEESILFPVTLIG